MKANFYNDPNYGSQRTSLENNDKARVLDTTTRLQRRFLVQEIILHAFADMGLDAVVYPTSNIPPIKLGAPNEPNVNGRGDVWSALGAQGFPVITVQAGFTTHVYDRVDDPTWQKPPGWVRGPGYTVPGSAEEDKTILVGPTPAVLPVGMDIVGRPFSEPTLIAIAGAFQDATHHRHPPPDFGPLSGNRPVASK
jgi:Asp-tRNA(Asn)/Glu-tRNA(Gln) amidotransferase A subunit family amidase